MTSQDAILQHDLSAWIDEVALPLWSSTGLDMSTGTVWEALDHSGLPLKNMERRLRVQVRQAYCFAKSDKADDRALGLRLFRFAMDKGFDPETGNLAGRLTPDARILQAPHDAYDLAFMLLAASALIEAGFEISQDLEYLVEQLARLKAPRGWYENVAQSLPRRQNPHMHLFEATTALYAVTKDARFQGMAEECLGLLQDVFLSDGNRILEFFDADWQPLVGDSQAVEPGHMAEWVYLLDRYETVFGCSCGIALEPLFHAVWQCRDGLGLIPDHSEPFVSDSRRLWPQTELLKASVVLMRRGVTLPLAAQPSAVLAQMWWQYFETNVPGGWYDKRSLDGQLLSTNMPASTFYHILVALRVYIGAEKAI